MAFKTFFFAALFASTVSVILSIPQYHILPVGQPPEPVDANQHQDAPAINELPQNNPPQVDPRLFQSLFNISAYLANAPNNTAALNFIPLITILSAALGG